MNRQNFARLNPDGSLDAAYDPAIAHDASVVTALQIQPDHKLLAAGSFSYSGGAVSGPGIIRLNEDGSIDETFLDTGDPGYVGQLALQANGQIIIAGSFDDASGGSLRLMRLNTDGTVDESFESATGRFAGSPIVTGNLLALQPDGKVIVGGEFSFVDGQAHGGLVRLDSAGVVDAGFNVITGSGYAVSISSVAVRQDGLIAIGGDFASVNGAAKLNLSGLAPDGSAAAAFDFGAGAYTGRGNGDFATPNIQTLVFQPDGKLLAAGLFFLVNGTERSNIVRLNTDGSVDSGFGSGTGISGIDTGLASGPVVNSMALAPDGKVLISGEFADIDNVNVDYLARLNADGTFDPSFNVPPPSSSGSAPYPSYNFAAGLNSMAVQPDEKVIIGGSFAFNAPSAESGIARLNSDRTVDTTFDTGSGVDGFVTSVLLQPDGKILIGGGFGMLNGVARGGVARLNADGSVDASFDSGIGAGSNIVGRLQLQPDGRVIVGGSFTSFNGVVQDSVARLNADGSVDTSFDPGNAMGSNSVSALALQSDGKVLAGGGDSVVRLNGDPARPAFFTGAMNVNNDFFYLAFANGTPFGFYSYDYFPYLYHSDLGFEYFTDAQDGNDGAYLYDFGSGTVFYTSPSFPFPFLYDFSLQTVLYYFPDAARPGHYTSNPRYFYNFATGKIITK